ncbi:uncharacterized protein LOC143449539 [Clavelina lepadiformis]|uniref:uncharacterized protein LOC143449539 n=1 Tax=Clavelina lepadiformis TaxID=159417 RepID=UPI004041D985
MHSQSKLGGVKQETNHINFLRVQRKQATAVNVMNMILNGAFYNTVKKTERIKVEIVDYEEESLDNTGGGIFLPPVRNRRIILVEIEGGNYQRDLAAIQRQLDPITAGWCHPTGDTQPEVSP